MDENNRQSTIGEVAVTEITAEMKKSYLDYAMSVIVSRALPDVRDGLKPVQRRILFAMHQIGLGPGAKFQKSAKIVGETMGKYHPHGDGPIYDAMVNLAQEFSMRYPLVNGQGNFGSIDGDPPAAMRYTEAKLTKISTELLGDIDKETIPFTDNFDSTLKEPVYLPAKLPNLLIMGAEGIAVGMATKIPPHNLGEIIDGVLATISQQTVSNHRPGDQPIEIPTQLEKLSAVKRERLTQTLQEKYQFDSEITVEQLINLIKGPDFPTSGVIFDQREIIKAYSTGKGKIPVRGVAEIEELKGGKTCIVISQLPYQVNKARLVTKIADLVKNRRINGVTDLRDESSREGIRVVVDLSRSARPNSILNNLYKYTDLQTSFPVNTVALVNGTPQTLSLKTILVNYVSHRQEVIIRRGLYELERARYRAHILEGLRIALRHLDAVIKTIKRSADVEKAKENLIKKFKLSVLQAEAILDMQLRRLAALERKKIEDEYRKITSKIAEIEKLLKSQPLILKTINQELLDLKEKYADPRKTKVMKRPLSEISKTDLIPQEETIVVFTADNYIKRVPVGTYRTQHRGGRGVTGMTTKEADEITHLVTANTHDNLLLFTNKGKVYSTKVYEVGEGSRRSRGQALVNLVNIDPDEEVFTILPVKISKNNSASSSAYLFFTTRQGTVKKTPLSQFQNIRSSGLIALTLKPKDELVWVKPTSGQNQIMIITHEGKSIRFQEEYVRAMGRSAAGVRGIKLGKNDFVVDMAVLQPKPKEDILVVSENGLGKRVMVKNFPIQNRGGQGVKILKVSKKTGKVAAVALVGEKTQEVILTSKTAQTIKLPLKNVPRMGRNTQGVILVRLGKDDQVAALTCLES